MMVTVVRHMIADAIPGAMIQSPVRFTSFSDDRCVAVTSASS